MLAAKHTARPEHELLLCCARTIATSQTTERLRLIAGSSVDWEYFFLIAQRHSVLPLVYQQLRQNASELVPVEVLTKFKSHYQQNAARNGLLTAELCRLVELLRESQIEAIPFKGPSLSLFAYNDITLRRFVDLDILVKKDDVFIASEILTKDAYRVAKSLSLEQRDVLLQTQHNIQFSRDNQQLIVELHWDVAPQLFGTLHANDLWSRLSQQTLNNKTVKVLAAEDLLFSLCIHGSRHLWERLAWICDIAELISRCQFDWTTLLKRAIALDNERMFLLGVYLAHGLLDARLPDDLKLHCENDPSVLELAHRVIENLFKGHEHVPATSAEVFRYNFEVRKTWRARARYLKYMMSPSDRDVTVRNLPHGLTFVYYFTRPFRLLFKRGRSVNQLRNR